MLLGFVVLEGEWVNLLFVHPGRPARGVGAALLDLVKSLRPHGFGLRVYQVNERARAFYARHGLVELERTDGSGYLDAEPDVQMAWLGDDPLAYLRRRIDAVDDELAVLLARRTALTAAVQDHKATTGEYAGQRGRDAGREAEIVARMAQHVPELGPERIAQGDAHRDRGEHRRLGVRRRIRTLPERPGFGPALDMPPGTAPCHVRRPCHADVR